MNIDNLHDALNLLDDDLIHEVDVLRSERMQQTIKGSREWIVRWMSLAACFVIFLVSAYAVSTLLLRGFGGAKKSDSSVMVEENTVKDNIKEESVVDNTGDVDENAMPSQQESTVTDNSSAATGENKSDACEIKVEVIELKNEGFVGVIKESADTEMYTVGTELTVVLMEDKWLVEGDTIDVQHKDYVTDDVAFPVGSVVIVRFMPQENTRPNGGTDTENTEYILYADEITFEDHE